MSEAKQLLGEKKAITPLWIVALFVSLTETILGIAVTQTLGGIQIALTVFVLAFPILIAGSFFLTLWHKPYVFYPPTEFGTHTNVIEYVEAMQRKPAFLKQYSETQESQYPSEREKKAVDEIADLFFERTPPAGKLCLYALSIAYSQNIAFDLQHLTSKLPRLEFDYAYGFLIATKSCGLIQSNWLRGNILNVTFMHEKLVQLTVAAFDDRINNIRIAQGGSKESLEAFKSSIFEEKNLITQYLNEQ